MSTTTPHDVSAPAQLAPLPHPVVFVFRDRTGEWDDLFRSGDDPPAVETMFWRFDVRPAINWVIQTYIQLRRRGLDVRLSDRAVPGMINVASRFEFGPRSRVDRCYVVACRHDSPRPWICEQAIVQNPRNVESPRDHLIQHWPQPNLIPRDPSRGARLERLVYKGAQANLWEEFRGTEFRRAMTGLGVEFVADDQLGGPETIHWHDYSEADALLAVRDLTEPDYLVKPASKLINAWHAGVPALLGPEPAYQALRLSDLDFFEVRNVDDVARVVLLLKYEPELYEAVVANGLKRAREFTVDRIAERWRDVLAGPVAAGYERWLGQGRLRRALRPAVFAGRLLADRFEYRAYLRQRDHGFRPISGRHT